MAFSTVDRDGCDASGEAWLMEVAGGSGGSGGAVEVVVATVTIVAGIKM
jgi:hypothetical protein